MTQKYKTLSVHEDTYKKIKALSVEEHRTMTHIIVLMVNRYIKQKKEQANG